MTGRVESAGVEERTVGALSWGVVSLYVMAAGGFGWLVSVMLMYIMEQLSKIYTDLWVGWWSVDRCRAAPHLCATVLLSSMCMLFSSEKDEK